MDSFRTQIKELLWIGIEQITRNLELVEKEKSLNKFYIPNEIYQDKNKNLFKISYSTKEKEIIINGKSKILGDYKINKTKL